MKVCSIPGCHNKHEGLGFCKRHYKSFRRHGNAAQVDINKAATEKKKAIKELKAKIKIPGRLTREGGCEVPGCKQLIKARRLCDKHYTRERRTGTTDRKGNAPGMIKHCLVIGCKQPHQSKGYCNLHANYNRHHGSPYLAKVIKLCGVKGCEDKHLAKGLCKKHYQTWRKTLEINNLQQ